MSLFKVFALKATKFVVEHKEQILIGTSTALTIGGGVCLVKATVSATKEVEEMKMERAEAGEPAPTKKEIIKHVGKKYIVPVTMILTAIIANVVAVNKSLKKAAASAAALKVSEETLDIINDKLKKEVGDAKAQEIVDSSKEEANARLKVNKELSKYRDTHIVSPYNYYLRDHGTLFLMTMDRCRAEIIDFEKKYLMSGYCDQVSVNELHDFLDIPNSNDGEDRFFKDGVAISDTLDFRPTVENGIYIVDVVYDTYSAEKLGD